jgi:hypothetical protein
MTDNRFRPDQIIDRESELGKFTKLLSAPGRPRLLAIQDKSGTGKSELMKLLEFEARRNSALTCLVELDGEDRFGLVDAMVKRLKTDHFVGFPAYERVNAYRLSGNFADAVGVPHAPVPQELKLILQDNEIRDANVGAIQNIMRTDPDAFLRDRALDSFVEEFQARCGERPLVLLLDRFDRGSPEAQQWFLGMLRGRVFARDQDAFGQLLVVIAGEDVRLEELPLMLGDRFEQDADVIHPLTLWNEEHIRTWLTRSGVPHRDVDIQSIHWRMHEGVWSLQQIRAFYVDI